MKSYYVYIMTNKSNNVLYTRVTNNLRRRIYEHQNKLSKGFTSRYNVNKLVYFEETTDVESALMREKQIKAGSRQKKVDLVCSFNTDWKDLSSEWE